MRHSETNSSNYSAELLSVDGGLAGCKNSRSWQDTHGTKAGVMSSGIRLLLHYLSAKQKASTIGLVLESYSVRL